MSEISIKERIEVVKAGNEALKTVEALRIAVRALAWYANEKNWEEDDWGLMSVVQPPDYGKAGEKARRAIKRIERALDPDRVAPSLKDDSA